MLRTVGAFFRNPDLIEFAGAGLIVAGTYEKAGWPLALIVAGIALVLKAFSVDSGGS